MSYKATPTPGVEGAGPDLDRDNWGWLLALGFLWVLLGTVAIVMPFTATLAIEAILGALFLAGGIAQIVQATRGRGTHGSVLNLVAGLLSLVLGSLLLFYPLQGVLTLTLALSAFFFVQGILKLLWAAQHRFRRGWIWMLLSGFLGITVGTVIWLGWPGGAIWVLRVVVGIELLFSGWALVMLALAMR